MKKGIGIWLLMAVLGIILIAFTVCNVSFGASSDAHAAASVAFDKQAMYGADRIVVTAGEVQAQITDSDLIALVTLETAAATHIKFSCPEDRRIDIYRGDRLIRSMGWSTCCDMVNVYDTDGMHWVVSVEGIEDGGSVCLSQELLLKLNEQIQSG